MYSVVIQIGMEMEIFKLERKCQYSTWKGNVNDAQNPETVITRNNQGGLSHGGLKLELQPRGWVVGL
jgi:hypothetical protein